MSSHRQTAAHCPWPRNPRLSHSPTDTGRARSGRPEAVNRVVQEEHLQLVVLEDDLVRARALGWSAHTMDPPLRGCLYDRTTCVPQTFSRPVASRPVQCGRLASVTASTSMYGQVQTPNHVPLSHGRVRGPSWFTTSEVSHHWRLTTGKPALTSHDRSAACAGLR